MSEPEWKPIESGPRVDGQFNQPRIMVWLPAVGEYIAANAAFAHYDPDSFARKPRPYWSIEGQRTSDSRSRQPTHWAEQPSGPKQDERT